MKNPLIIALLTLCTAATAAAQCNTFDCAYKEAQRLLNSTEKDKYTKAMAHLEDAENLSTSSDKAQNDKIRALRKKAFAAIEKERKDAIDASEEAKKQKEASIAAQKRADATLDKIYFYDDRFGLAYDKGRFGYIDRNLNTKIRFLYEDGSQFGLNGFAKVIKNNQSYLIDTLGHEYLLASYIHQFSDSTEAIDLSSQDLDKFPDEILKCKKLKILILPKNSISIIPQELKELKEIFYIDVSNNRIETIPSSISTNDKILINILGNPININEAQGSIREKVQQINAITVLEQYSDLEYLMKQSPSTTFVLHFWATYCTPTLNEFSYFDSLELSLNGKSAKILHVSLDFKDQMETRLFPFLQKYKPKSEVVLLADQDFDSWIPKVSEEWDGAIPCTVIVNPNGDKKAHLQEFTSYQELARFYLDKSIKKDEK